MAEKKVAKGLGSLGRLGEGRGISNTPDEWFLLCIIFYLWSLEHFNEKEVNWIIHHTVFFSIFSFLFLAQFYNNTNYVKSYYTTIQSIINCMLLRPCIICVCVCTKLVALPLPPLHITALESPTFATSKRSPTRMAVEAVEPASLLWLFSDFRNSESVWLYASAVENKSLAGKERITVWI